MPVAPDAPGDVPDTTILPTQLRRCSRDSPARALALAVLRLALADLNKCGPVNGNGSRAGPQGLAAWRARMARDARAWIDADDGRWPYSFVGLCSVLGLDPGAVRSALAGRRAA
jgi:hypothetical protein